jgi:hypothetical protein
MEMGSREVRLHRVLSQKPASLKATLWALELIVLFSGGREENGRVSHSCAEYRGITGNVNW